MVELLCNYVKLMLICLASYCMHVTSWRHPRDSASCRNGYSYHQKGSREVTMTFGVSSATVKQSFLTIIQSN